ncbi:MAG: pilus assembly protein [Anaerolineae bacterium]|nr:pilus assembly protein [Anaerolineae bacterium]
MFDRFRRFKKRERGQSLVELALILPVLILLFLGLIELGLALRAYLVVVNANREAARFAARGTNPDEDVARRVIMAFSGQLPARTIGADPNTGIVVTRLHVRYLPDGTYESSWDQPVYVTGTLQTGDPVLDAKIRDNILMDPQEELERLEAWTKEINEGLKKEEGATAVSHTRVVVEVLYLHPQYLHAPIFEWIFPDPMALYSKTDMREGSGRVN